MGPAEQAAGKSTQQAETKYKECKLGVKIVRQPKKIALIGAPSSAGAFSPGTEKAPTLCALRGSWNGCKALALR